MKSIPVRLAGLIMAIFFLSNVPQPVAAQDVEVSFQSFYDELTPYGTWIDDPEYGNVWVPNEEAGYRPYASRGHWAMTEYGNMWVSDVPWGWACYHYGRWTYNPYYGWVWVPGYEWAPAWVSWRSGGGYYGWAPMTPGISVGMSYDYPDNYWVFVGPDYLYQPNVYSYYQPRHVRRYITQTTIINETYIDNSTRITYYYGPRREVIERECHRPVQVYNVSRTSAPRQTNISGNTVQIYRPAVNRSSFNTARPSQVVRAPQPVGRPQSFSRYELNRQPEFRQTMPSRGGNPSGRYEQSRRDSRYDNRPQDDIYQNNRRGGDQGVRSREQSRPEPQRFDNNRQQREMPDRQQRLDDPNRQRMENQQRTQESQRFDNSRQQMQQRNDDAQRQQMQQRNDDAQRQQRMQDQQRQQMQQRNDDAQRQQRMQDQQRQQMQQRNDDMQRQQRMQDQQRQQMQQRNDDMQRQQRMQQQQMQQQRPQPQIQQTQSRPSMHDRKDDNNNNNNNSSNNNSSNNGGGMRRR